MKERPLFNLPNGYFPAVVLITDDSVYVALYLTNGVINS